MEMRGGIIPGGLKVDDAHERRALVAFATARVIVDGDASQYRLNIAGADLSFLQSGRAPVLADHVATVANLLGVVETAWLYGDVAAAVIRFGRSAAALDAWENVAAGVLCNVSLGYRHNTADVQLDADGKFIIQRWFPYELSMVPVPANADAHVVQGRTFPEIMALAEAARAGRNPSLTLP